MLPTNLAQVYTMTDYVVENSFVAAIVTYLVDQALVWVRMTYGQRNIAKKTLVDDRFLA